MRKRIYLLLLLLPMFNSCEYSPTAVNYNQIAPPEANPGIDIVLDEKKVTALRGEVEISYFNLLKGRKLLSVNAYLNDKYITSGYAVSNSGVFKFDTRHYADGPYKLTLELVTSTNTGSLADKLGSEVYVLRKQYQSYIYNSAVIAPQIVKAEAVDGSLKLTWRKYTQPAFQKYIISRDASYPRPVGEVTDINDTSFIDDTYGGTPASYIVETVVGGMRFRCESFDISIPQNFSFNAQIVDENRVKLTWRRSIFYTGLQSYEISRFNYERDEVAVINNPDDTTFTDLNPVFGGGETQYDLNIRGKDGNSWSKGTVSVRRLGYNTEYYFPTRIVGIPEKNLLYIYGNTYLFKVDAASLKTLVKSQVPNAFCISHDASQSYCILSNDYKTQIAKIDPDNLAITAKYFLRDIAGKDITMLYNITVSDNNLLFAVVREKSSLSSPLELLAIDMNSLKIISQKEIPEYTTQSIMTTPDGEYIMFGKKLYEFRNNQFTELGDVEYDAVFSKDFSSIVQVKDGNCLQILNLKSRSVISELTIPSYKYSGAVLRIDEFTGLLGISNYAKYFIVDLNKNSLIKTFRIGDPITSFVNGKLITSGKYLEVNFGN